MSQRKLRIIVPILVIVLVSFSGRFGPQVANRQPTANNAIYVDGATYPYTAAGVEAAINALNPPQGMGGSVMLPAARIDLGSAGLTMRKHVCLIGVSSDSTWLTYNGTGTAVTFPAGMADSCLKQLTVALGANAGTSATAITVRGDFNASLITTYNKIQDVTVWAGAVHPGQIGLNLSGADTPSSIQLSWFDTIKLLNLGQPIVTNGQEGNFWNNIQIVGFSALAVNDRESADNFWQLRITGSLSQTASAIGFQEAGVMNQIRLTCDMGIKSQTCVNDLGGRNVWDVSALTPHGMFAASSFVRTVGARQGNIPAKFQVPTLPSPKYP